MLGADESPGRDIRVLLVEDHAAVRQALAAMFEREADFDAVSQAATLAEARTLLDDIDVAVVDLALPDGDGADLIPELRSANPRAHALVLSANLDRGQTAHAIKQGAAAALDKTADLDEVVDAVRRMHAGETLIPQEEVLAMLRDAERRGEQEQADRRALAQLTGREREVLEALAEGLDAHAIGLRLHITHRTARNHVASILSKLGVHSQLQAVVFAVRYGVVEIR